MGLIDEVEADPVRAGGTCWLTKLRVSDPEFAAEVEEAFAADLSTAKLTRAINARDESPSISAQTVARHNRHECTCQS